MRARAATEADRNRVFDIYMHPAVVPYLDHDPMSADAFVAVFADLLTRNLHVYEDEGGTVSGFYRVSRGIGRSRHVAQIGNVAVAPELHGTGIAGAMFAEALGALAKLAVTRVELLVEADNARGRAFYERFGFEVEATLRAAYRRASDSDFTNELLMVRFA